MAKTMKLTAKPVRTVAPALTANQVRARKAVETRKANLAAAAVAAELEAKRIASLTPGQKAAETKRANGTHNAAALKAAATKRANAAAAAAAAPAMVSAPVTSKPVATVATGQPVDAGRLLALLPTLQALGLI
jgi:hypothetical protein